MLMLRAKKLPGISPRAWEHPTDKAALSVLKQIKGLDELVKMLLGGTTERSIRLLHVANCVKVTSTQFPRIKVLLDRVVDVMDWPYTPEVFVAQQPLLQCRRVRGEDPFHRPEQRAPEIPERG
jgi:hypothetical protein